MKHEQMSLFEPGEIPEIPKPIRLVKGVKVVIFYSEDSRCKEVETHSVMKQFVGKIGVISNVIRGTSTAKYYSVVFEDGSTGIFYENEVMGAK